MYRAFCIVCRKLMFRCHKTLAHIRERGINVEEFYGVHARSFGIAGTTKAVYNGVEWVPTSVGHMGCYLSHYMLWSALLYMPQEETLVFEDDVILPDDFRHCLGVVSQYLPALWGFVHLGHCGYQSFEQVSGPLGKPSPYPYGTHAYLINRAGARRLLETIKPLEIAIDMQLAKDCWPHMAYYCSIDSLADQRSLRGEWPSTTNEGGAAGVGDLRPQVDDQPDVATP